MALLAAATYLGFALSIWHDFLDLGVYRVGARQWLDGGRLYGAMPPVGDIHLPFTYPPLAAIVFAPLAMIPKWAADATMFSLTLAAVGLTLWLVLARLRPATDRGTRLTLVVAGVAAAQFLEPVRETLDFGQVNALLMAAVAVDTLVRHPRWPRGLLIGIAVSIKLTPAGFLLFFLLRRDWRGLATAAASTAGSVAVAWVVMPEDSYQYWFRTLAETGRIGTPSYAGNQSLKGLAYRLGLGESAGTAVWIVLSLVAVALAAMWMRRLLADDRVCAAVVVNAAAVLLVSPVSWTHHWVWAAPAIAIGAVAVADGRRGRGFVAALAFGAALFYLGPQWWPPHEEDRELAWSWWQQILGNGYVLFTFATLVTGAFSAYRVRGHNDSPPVTVDTKAALTA